MPFDWQAELASPAAPAPPPRLQLPQLTAPLVRHVFAPSFAQVLTSTVPSQTIDDPLPQPSIKGEQLRIRISQPIYEKGVDYCKKTLRGRLILNKGDKPYTSTEIHQRLQKHWNTSAPWSLLSLGRGYYEFYFASEADMRSVWAKGTIILKPGVLRLFEWKKDFNMHKQKNTHAQVWIRLIELPQEYWMDRTLREIASAVGTPLTIDNATSKRLYGHYARILVDMDCSKKLFYEILVKREGFSFPVEVVYEWMPDYCTHCQNLGHHVTSCRWLYPKKVAKEPIANIDKGKTKAPVENKDWVPLQTNPSGISSSNAFAAFEVTNTKETETVKHIAAKAFAAPTIHAETQKSMSVAAMPTIAAPTQQQTSPRVSDEIPQEPVQPVLELVDDVHGDVLSDDVEHVNSESRDGIPRIHNAHETHPSLDAHVYEHSLTIDLEASASAKEMSPTQLDSDDAQDDVQSSPRDGPFVVRFIPDDTATF